jgi:hypothetical protein
LSRFRRAGVVMQLTSPQPGRSAMTRRSIVPPKLPTPTCTHHQTTEIQCLTCLGKMRLVTIEPGVPNFELRRYACPQCDTGESFLMSIESSAANAGSINENSRH